MSQKRKKDQTAPNISRTSSPRKGTSDVDLTSDHHRLGGSRQMHLPFAVQQELSRRVRALIPRRPLLPEAVADDLRAELVARMPESPEEKPRRKRGD